MRALTLASCLLPPVEYNGIHDEDIFLGDGSHIETIGKNYAVFSDTICFCIKIHSESLALTALGFNTNFDLGNDDETSTSPDDCAPSGYNPFRRGSIRDMISTISQFAAGSKDDESFSTDATGHLTTNTMPQTTVSMSKSPQALAENLHGNTFNQNVPQLTLSFSDGSSNDHHLAFCLFEVCLGLREFTIQKGNLPVKERRKNPNVPISLSDYHNWFLSGFTIWINVAAKQVHIF